jgi:uncharacterized protein YggE
MSPLWSAGRAAPCLLACRSDRARPAGPGNQVASVRRPTSVPTRTVLAGATAAAAALAISLSGCGGAGAANRTSTPTTRPAGARSPSPANAGSLSPVILTAGSTGAGSSGSGTITTEGVGTVSGAPDTMTLSINVSTSATHASAALAQNNSVAMAVQQALERGGVLVKDIQTTGLSLQQTYPPTPAGYQVDDEVSATVRNLLTAGAVIDSAVAAAGDAGRLDGVSFSMSDTSPLMVAARQQAVAAARSDAVQLAAAAGAHLGALVSLTDQSQPTNSGTIFGAQSAAGTAASVPVPVRPGTQQLTVDVTAVWDVVP